MNGESNVRIRTANPQKSGRMVTLRKSFVSLGELCVCGEVSLGELGGCGEVSLEELCCWGGCEP